MKSIIIYHEWIPKVGGIETWLSAVAKTLKAEGYDVRIGFKGYQDYRSILKYGSSIEIFNVDQKAEFECDTLIIATNHYKPANVHGKRVIQVLHSDYSKYHSRLVGNEVDQYVAVSKHASKVAKKMFGIDCKVIYNYPDPDFVKPNEEKERVLKLITASRISPEKGMDRMLILANQLKARDIPFEWHIYGDNQVSPSYEQDVKKKFDHLGEVYFFGYKEDVRRGLVWADYLVQLSDFEGCPYAVLEALKFEVPVILTDYLGAKEIVEDGKNGYLVPLDMKKIDLKRIVEKIPKFKYKPLDTVKSWKKIL